MEVDLGASAEAEQYGVEVDDFLNIDGNSFGGERCGICMDVIIDRGVLDCCQHWFCFGCIDNWATITNLCPLCQNEFQLITCVPVYDTIGSSKVDDESYPRDDDWLVEGKNNTLSFPSYYIDENAVICLDGSGCKIRNGSATSEEDADLDTSIACDSCDLWYHAFCVGFDTEGTSESTWLCPRCVVEEMPQNQEGNLLQLGEDEYTRKVSVSVADEGETAMVVSMVGPSKFEEIETDTKSQSFVFSSEDNYQMFTHSTAVEAREVESALPCETSLGFSNVFVKNELESFGNEPGSDPIVDRRSNFKGIGSLEEKSANELSITNNSSNDSFDTGVHQQQLHVDDVNMNVIEDGLNEGVKQNESLEESKPTAGKSVLDVDEDALGITGVKRKLWDSSDHIDSNAHEDSETEITDEISPPKKMRSEDQELKCDSEPENGAADIMSIVRSTKRRPSKGGQKCEDKSAIEAETTTGLRVKKIMKRASKDKESSVAVQTLRKEIREAVRNKSIEDSGENLFDPKLLAAFRVAVSSPKTESVKMMSQLSAKTKKLMLQKGKVRENLTKKIYSLSNGRRKRAWDRDCEVEFWKHRCLRASKPEKIETLKSVLDLLRNNSESSGTREKSERHGSDTILSRLYLADTSVCPRKDDIKPLAVLKNSGDTKPALAEKLSKSVSDGSGSLVEKKNSVASGKDGKVQISKLNARKETMAVKSGDVKVDKRKWALEVLARRASGGDTSASEKQGDEAVLKGNYPLLAQLPVEMRPVLAPSRRNKIPMSVRQAQLYRLTEQLLRKANLPVIRRSAETELAVADAINIERAVADRSSSKPVYINLCSQELRQHSENKPREAPEDDTSVSDPSTIPIEGSQQSEEDPSIQALRNAGLLSDSPPNSPGQDQLEEEEGPENVLEMDEVPDLDIYGEFEYSLDDEDYIGVSAAKAQPEVAAPKMKLVFSTLTLENPTNASDSDKPDACAVAEKPNRAGDSCAPREPLFGNEGEEPSVAECEELYGPDKESLTKILPTDESMKLCEAEKSASVGECSPNRSETGETVQKKEKKSNAESGSKRPDNSISKKVEAYIKEHVRPLCKSGIITVEQYRWAVSKTREKVMKYHSKAKNANFLIKEGEKVKKLAEQYVETAQQKE